MQRFKLESSSLVTNVIPYLTESLNVISLDSVLSANHTLTGNFHLCHQNTTSFTLCTYLPSKNNLIASTNLLVSIPVPSFNPQPTKLNYHWFPTSLNLSLSLISFFASVSILYATVFCPHNVPHKSTARNNKKSSMRNYNVYLSPKKTDIINCLMPYRTKKNSTKKIFLS